MERLCAVFVSNRDNLISGADWAGCVVSPDDIRKWVLLSETARMIE